ncbi:MAG: hypothetical protein WAL84_04665 [Candidatus Dormiibacterota bacterium]
MSTDKADEQAAPGVHGSETDEDEEDTSGHKFVNRSADPAEQPSVYPRATPDEDDTEGHVKNPSR